MKLIFVGAFVLLLATAAYADLYVHNPRGSNNRLDEQNRYVPNHMDIPYTPHPKNTSKKKVPLLASACDDYSSVYLFGQCEGGKLPPPMFFKSHFFCACDVGRRVCGS